MEHANGVFIHPTADVSRGAHVGAGSRIWHQAQVREGARVGVECILGKNVYVDADVELGDRVKVENNACIYRGVTIEDGVFIGPHVCFTNDMWPRAIGVDGSLKGTGTWTVGRIVVQAGASVGASSVILPGVTIGTFAVVGAGSVVTRSVPDQALVYGNPARQRGYVCRCGHRLVRAAGTPAGVEWKCLPCGQTYHFCGEQTERGGRT